MNNNEKRVTEPKVIALLDALQEDMQRPSNLALPEATLCIAMFHLCMQATHMLEVKELHELCLAMQQIATRFTAYDKIQEETVRETLREVAKLSERTDGVELENVIAHETKKHGHETARDRYCTVFSCIAIAVRAQPDCWLTSTPTTSFAA